MTPPHEIDRETLKARYDSLFSGIAPPFAFVDLDAMRRNATAMLAQAGGLPIRVASKSVRSTAVLRRIFELDPGFQGVLAFTAPEALYLAEQGFVDIVVAYPTVDRGAIAQVARLAADDPARAPVLMVDDRPHLDLIEGAIGGGPSRLRVCLDVDVSWWPLGGRLARIGPKRSPIHDPRAGGADGGRDLRAAGHRARRADGLRGPDRRGRRPDPGQAAAKRLDPVDAIALRGRYPPPPAANRRRRTGGGRASSRSSTAVAPAVFPARRRPGSSPSSRPGSGFYAPALFDNYRSLALEPAAFFSLPVVRRPVGGIATLLGGGYLASGAGGRRSMPEPYLPGGLRFDRDEGAGEVQTPVTGAAAYKLRVGDRVYLRHAKAGELCERFNSLYLVEGERIIDEVPTYRGEGKAFL